MIQNGIRMLDSEGELIKTIPVDAGEGADAEDTGEKGYNYRSERFANRLKHDCRISKIFNSRIHGDPATPLFRAYTGERVIFRTMMPAAKCGGACAETADSHVHYKSLSRKGWAFISRRI